MHGHRALPTLTEHTRGSRRGPTNGSMGTSARWPTPGDASPTSHLHSYSIVDTTCRTSGWTSGTGSAALAEVGEATPRKAGPVRPRATMVGKIEHEVKSGPGVQVQTIPRRAVVCFNLQAVLPCPPAQRSVSEARVPFTNTGLTSVMPLATPSHVPRLSSRVSERFMALVAAQIWS